VSGAFDKAAQALRTASCAVALTGAGISVESGIPSFRGDSGLWRKYPPEEYATIDAYIENPARVWAFWRERAHDFADCGPNAAHKALAGLEQRGILKAIVTQNIDHFHQQAGSRTVVEYHGNVHNLRCLDCGADEPLDIENMPANVPRCPVCRGLMKPDVVMFGELIPTSALAETDKWVSQCDVLIVVGTSAQVFPAAALPYRAKENGAFIIECNVEPTGFTRTVTDAFLEGRAAATLPRLAGLV